MKILDKYIGKSVLIGILGTLLILTSIRLLFGLIDELGDLGRGDYQFIDALYYSLLLVPQRMYELFPMAVLIGALFSLGLLANNSELTVMRAAGYTTGQIVWASMKATFLLMLLIIFVGEWAAPRTNLMAYELRTSERSDGNLSRSAAGIWAKDRGAFIHIGVLLPGAELQDVSIYHITDEQRLREVWFAKQASYVDGSWELKKIRISKVGDTKIDATIKKRMQWRSELTPQKISVLEQEPETLNIAGLVEYQRYLAENGLDVKPYELAFWRKLIQPATLFVMMLLAMSFVFGPMRNVSMGARILLGVIVGLAFHIANETFGPISLVFKLPPIWGAVLPVTLFLLVALHLMKKAR